MKAGWPAARRFGSQHVLTDRLGTWLDDLGVPQAVRVGRAADGHRQRRRWHHLPEVGPSGVESDT